MSKGTALVLAGGLVGSAITYGLVLSGESDLRQQSTAATQHFAWCRRD